MKLTEFLALSDDENALKAELLEFIKADPDNNAIKEKILACSESSLFKIALTDPKIASLCHSQALTHYWNELWRRCGINPKGSSCKEQQPIQEYLPIVTISSFNLLTGLFVYEKYRDLTECDTPPEELIKNAKEYLVLSAQHGCFFAMNALCIHGLKLLALKFDEKLFQEIILYAQLAAHVYWSPGYLLLSNVLRELIQYKHERSIDDLSSPSYQALCTAKLLEDSSSPMRNNAYQGKTYSEASQGVFKGFSQARMSLSSALNLTIAQINLAERKANLELLEVKRRYPAIFEHEADMEAEIDLGPIPTF